MHPSAGLLSPIDRESAVTVLQRRLPAADIRTFLKALQKQRSRRRSVEWIVTETEHAGERRLGRLQTRLPDGELHVFLVDFAGLDLLSHRELRRLLALRATPPERDALHDFPSDCRGRTGPESVAKAIAARRWHPGKAWPRHFVKVLGFPPAFAGLPGSPGEPDTAEVDPFRPLPALETFQQELLAPVRDVLIGLAGSNRGILTLPTGAGKTRTAVEAILEWRPQATDRRTVLWIAQSEELCEQAVQAFREVWIDCGHRDNAPRDRLLISRLWGGGRKVPDMADIVVASIQKLHAIWRGEDNDGRREDLTALAGDIGVVVIDEAHRMLAPSYAEVLGFIGIDLARDRTSPIPLLGLTATPFRGVEEETRTLVARFHGRLLRPVGLGDDPVGKLRAQGVLSHPDHEVLDYGGRAIPLDQDPTYGAYFERFGDFHPGLLEELGEESVRNRRILERLCRFPADWPVLFFGCSVEQATAMSVMLRRKARSAATVTADTRAATRRALIEEFRAGRISVLCNFGVLTTGFDAPKVRALVIARPTASPVLYEQMIGRGMRGPRFGGTDRCLVIDVADNIQFRGQMAFMRYELYWVPASAEGAAPQAVPVIPGKA
jgi:superfamily II DNA or RNA helicase